MWGCHPQLISVRYLELSLNYYKIKFKNRATVEKINLNADLSWGDTNEH
ncbi:hypothetical protein DSM107010_24940 [Chroococcidiopsis cubana SAG 39.79]|uniref:Uncharacterized protein n=1 Tax=Chroococcidiopsis cubana SAG 39.79 TaxID=388085 RepID=A0AB37ULI6_9CYAN|nr:hypothetical protein DSM107010_24940 [Chroococcidiopsis cubana SAG 39.79]